MVRPAIGQGVSALVLAAAIACGGGETRTLVVKRVVSPVDPSCGAPADAQSIIVTALGEFPRSEGTAENLPIAPGQTVTIGKFPEATRVLEIGVLGQGAVPRAIGRTRAFDLTKLPDGAELPVFSAAPRGFCAVGPLAVARARPLVARAGLGVLVAGGVGADDAPVELVEWYDPDRATFVSLADTFYGDETLGLVGATMIALPGGRVVVTGGAREAYQLYTAATGEIGPALLLDDGRAEHAAVALDERRVFLVGGCATLTATGACDLATARGDTHVLDVDTGALTAGPALAAARVRPTVALTPDGRVLVAGGVGSDGAAIAFAERVDPAGAMPSERIGGVASGAVLLPAGSALFAFGAATPTAEVWVAPLGAVAATTLAAAPAARLAPSMTLLEDGSLLALGGIDAGAGGAEAAQYVDVDGRFVDLASAPATPAGDVARRVDHGAVRLDDGTVLIVGGRATATAPAGSEAWIYRHDLTGPFTSELLIHHVVNATQAQLLVASDPARARRMAGTDGRPPYVQIDASDGDAATVSVWVIAAGPTFLAPRITARVGALAGGVGVLVGFVDASAYDVVELRPAEPARLRRVGVAAEPEVVCAGTRVEAATLDATSVTPTVTIEVQPDGIRAQIGDAVVLDCALDAPLGAGHVGFGPIGVGASVRLDSVTVVR
jgi:hypothetical protein